MNGFVTTSEAKSKSRYTYYKVLEKAKDGDLVRVRRGVYAKPEQLANTMIDIETIVPGGILCLFSAWNVYNLTTVIPQSYDIAIKRGRKVTLPDYPAISLHRFSDNILHLGETTKMVSGYEIKIYDVERCVCDAVKFRNKVGQDVCKEVVSNYLDDRRRDISKLIRYADQLRVKSTMEKYLEITL